MRLRLSKPLATLASLHDPSNRLRCKRCATPVFARRRGPLTPSTRFWPNSGLTRSEYISMLERDCGFPQEIAEIAAGTPSRQHTHGTLRARWGGMRCLRRECGREGRRGVTHGSLNAVARRLRQPMPHD